MKIGYGIPSFLLSFIERVYEIKKEVLEGVFSLSPQKLYSSPSESCDNGFSHSFSLPGFDFDLVVRIEKSDDLVLTALARMLSLF